MEQKVFLPDRRITRFMKLFIFLFFILGNIEIFLNHPPVQSQRWLPTGSTAEVPRAPKALWVSAGQERLCAEVARGRSS